MKKTIILLLILSLILSLFSCTNTPQTAPSTEIEKTFDPANNGESPFDFILTQVGEVIYKVYPEEGVLVPACPDPLCKHNTT